MIAPNLDALFDVETQVETACKTILTAAGFSAFMQRDVTEDVQPPYIGIQLTMGAVQGHRFTYNGNVWLDAWHATLGFEIVTKRSGQSSVGQNHALMRAQLRRFMQYASAQFGENDLPYHTLTMIQEAGTTPKVIGEHDEDISQLHFECVISIRANAWPVV